MLFYKYLKISLINFLNLPKKGAKRLFRLGSFYKISNKQYLQMKCAILIVVCLSVSIILSNFDATENI